MTSYAGVVLLAASLSGCMVVQRVSEPTPPSRPAADEGMLIYTVGDFSFEVPKDWEAHGAAGHVEAHPPDGTAKIDVREMEHALQNEKECLAAAQSALARGSGGLTNVRRHSTTVAGRRAVIQEADAGAWHGWAYAVCEGGRQYRIFLTGATPVKPETLDAFRLLVSSAQLGGTS